MSLSVEEMNKQLPVANALPGEAVPYYMASAKAPATRSTASWSP